ncbi:MAG: long-chain fatty acid--CoA ligase [Acidobacteriota bacterium]|jgi:long-chain acyl-CoA synthetase
MNPRTILDLYRSSIANPREGYATHYWPGGSRAFSTQEFHRRTVALAAALPGLGVKRGDRVMLLSENRPEWHMVDIATLAVGAVNVPVYPTLTPAQLAYQLRDSGAVLVVAENAEQMQKFLIVRGECPALEHLVQIDGACAEGVCSLEELVRAGDTPEAEESFWRQAALIQEDDLATIVYTSGTTGEPKGVMLTHRNFVSNALHILPRLPVTADDLVLEFLPLCHVFERCAGYLYLAVGARRAYCTVATVGELLTTIRPTAFCSVPRVFEKVYDRVHSRVATAPPLRRKLFHWALEIGRKAAHHRLAGTPMPAALALQHRIADALVLKKIRAAMGGRVRGIISGAAPLPLYANEFFHAAGIPVQEGYGLTETSPAIGVNGYLPGTNRLGSIGRALDNLEVKLAEDGELLVRGPSVAKGYWNKPEATAEVFDPDGFFHTGDIARIDEDGFIYITDRKKDIIVTAGGKNVAPQPIENRLKQSTWVDNAVLIGDRRPFIVALFSPNLEALTAFARDKGLPASDAATLVTRPEVIALYDAVVQEVNQDLARYEQIRKFRVLPVQLSIDTGHLTPTVKIKRRVVEKDFANLIEEMYS